MTGEMVSGDLVNLAERIRTEHQACLQSLRQGLEHAVKVGELLNEARELVQHGDWEQWVQDNCDFSPRMARRYIRAFSAVRFGLVETDLMSEMTLTDVLSYVSIYDRAERARKKAVTRKLEERKKRWNLELEDKQVKNYLDTVKGFRQSIREAVDAGEYGKFSPEAMRFTMRKHDELRKELDSLDAMFQKLLEGGEQ